MAQGFPNAVCVISLVDRNIHPAEILAVDGVSYRTKRRSETQQERRDVRRRNTHEPPTVRRITSRLARS